jgi:hypothetical protein
VSNYLAIATATAALRQLLQPPVQRAVPGAQVRAVRPDLMSVDRSAAGINLFLYQVRPNSAYRNEDLPTRRADGTLMSRPQAPLELAYLISCLGADDALEPQRLLGAVIATLHAWPMLPASQIASAVAADASILDGSDLASQLELIHITPDYLSTEELSRLWSTFGTVPYHLSVAYKVAVVLVQDDLTPLDVKPVEQVHTGISLSLAAPA